MTYNERIPKCDEVETEILDEGARLAASLVGEGERVLDAMCADDSFVRFLRLRGCETTRTPAPMDRASLREAAYGGFNVIAFGDALAFAREPLGILEEAREMLARGGRVVVCVPNAAHHAARADVLAERHCRFFTKKSLEDLLLQAGFHVERLGCVNDDARFVAAATALADDARARMLWERYAATDVELVHTRKRLASREREAEQARECADLADARMRESQEGRVVVERQLRASRYNAENAALEYQAERAELQARLDAAERTVLEREAEIAALRVCAEAVEQREKHLIGYAEAASAEYQAESERLALLIDTVQTSRFWRWKHRIARLFGMFFMRARGVAP